MPGGKSGRMQNVVVLKCLSSRKSVFTIPGNSHTGIGGLTPDRPDNTSLDYGSGGAVKNKPRDTSDQRTP